MSAASSCTLLVVLVACGPSSQGAAPQAGSGSAVSTDSSLPVVAQDAGREQVQDARQETKTVTAPAVLASANDAFEYKVGNPHFEGRTIVRVTGDGKAEASFERGGKTQRYEGTVPPAKLKVLRSSLTDHAIDRYKRSNRNLVPDEATIDLTVVTAGVRTHASLPANDRHDIDALGDLVELVQDIASKVSGGKIEY